MADGPNPARIDSRAMVRAMLGSDVDVVRVPLNEDCWPGVDAPARRSGHVYRGAIERYVRELNSAGLFAILDLHWASPGGTAAKGQLPMADASHAPAFWRSVARAFRADGDGIFDLYSEPCGISRWLSHEPRDPDHVLIAAQHNHGGTSAGPGMPPTPGSWSCGGGPALITSYRGTPTPYGAGFRSRLRTLGTPVRP